MRKIVLAAMVLMLGASACTDSTVGGSGKTQVLLTDDPFPYGDIAQVNLYISSIEASTSLDTGSGLIDTLAGAGAWTSIAQPEKTYNLLDFQSGNTVLAGEVNLPAGQYRAVRVTINTAQSHVIRKGGTEVNVHWPVNGLMTLYAFVENALDVPAGGAQIVIDFDVGRSFLVLPTFAPPTEMVFSPWLRAVNATGTGGISGTVTGPGVEGGSFPVPDASVLLITSPGFGAAGAIVGSARTDLNGHYVLAYVHAGDYAVTVAGAPGFAYTQGNVGTHVSSGEVSTVNLTLQHGSDSTTTHPDTSGTTPGGPVASVTLRLSTPNQTTAVGVCDSMPMIADLRNAAGGIVLGRAVTWSVTDSSVMTLQGVFGQYSALRALKAGSSTVTATSEGKSASLTFTVTGTGTGTCGGVGGGNNTPVATVTFVPASLTMAIGDSTGATVNLKDAANQTLNGRTVTFSLSDSTVAHIMGAFGQFVILRAIKAGTATLTAVSEGKSGTAAVTVH